MSDNRIGYALVIFLIGILAVSVSFAFAQDEDVISACVGENGHLRIVDDASQCKSQEAYLEWSNGKSANIGLPIVGNYVVSERLPNGIPHVIHCDIGDMATGGGYSHDTDNISAKLSAFRPYPETGMSTGWYFIAQAPDQVGYVSCLDVYPEHFSTPTMTGTSTSTATPTPTIEMPTVTMTGTPTPTPVIIAP